MTLKTRIASLFALLTAFILISISLSIYWFSYSYNEIQFFDRLHERVNIAAQYYFGEKELGSRIIDEIRQRHLQLLPQEKEFVVTLNSDSSIPQSSDSIFTIFSTEFIDALISSDSTEFRNGDILAFGRNYKHDGVQTLVIVSAYDQFGVSKMSDLRNKMIALFFIYMVLVFIISRIYAIQILKPVNIIIQKVNQIGSTNLDIRLDENHENDELGELAKTFNRMLDRVETSLEIQNNFVSNASHELKNPLTAILGEIEITLSKPRSAEELEISMVKVSKEATRLHSLTLHLLRLAQTSFDNNSLHLQEFRIDELIFDIKDDLEASLQSPKIHIDFDQLPADSDDLLVKGNADLIKVALTNIIENGCKFSKNELVSISIEREKKNVLITVIDKGVGIPEDEVKNIYVPFFRATNARVFNGFGIGLPLTNKIVLMHKGLLEVQSKVGFGTTFKMFLPASH